MSDVASRSRPPAVRSTRFRVGALIAVAVVIGLILWLALSGGGGNSSKAPQAVPSTPAAAVSVPQLRQLAATLGHPIFWVGPKRNYTYELTQAPNGSIYLRYLPPGIKVGAPEAYLSVATYPFPGAYGAIQSVSRGKDATAIRLPRRGLGVVFSSYPASVHLAYPSVDYQIEVFDPTAGVATALAAGGKVAALGSLHPATPAQPTAMSAAGLRSLATKVGHQVYWAGPRRGYTYEVRQGTGGQVYIRYLPPGAQAGSSQPYLTIATYPFPGAYAATKGLTQQDNEEAVKVPRGGIGVVNTGDRNSVHVAYPNSDVQVEVYDPSPAAARQIVSSGNVRAIG